jgi:ABC-type glycerol-3-phosphate transport system substrate-binding protein
VNAAAAVANAPEEQAKGAAAFLDWILTEKGQAAMGATFRGPIVPGYKNPEAKIDLSNVKMIDYNFTWAGENQRTPAGALRERRPPQGRRKIRQARQQQAGAFPPDSLAGMLHPFRFKLFRADGRCRNRPRSSP